MTHGGLGSSLVQWFSAKRLGQVRRLVMLLVVFAALPIAILSGLLAWTDYRQTMAGTRGELQSLASLMEEHVRVLMAANRIQLARAADKIGDRPVTELKDSPADWEKMRRLVSDLPGAHSLWLVDENADLVLSTMERGLRLNVSDREYFQALKPDGADLFISPLIWGKLFGGHFFAVSRRLTAPGGAFGGVVQLSIDAGYLLKIYDRLASHEDTSFTILKPDGSIVFRAPLPLREPDRIPAGNAVLRLMAEGPAEGMTVVRPLEKVGLAARPDRIAAYRRMADDPLILMVSRSEAAVLAPWRARTLQHLSLAGGLLALLFAVGALAARSARGETEASAALQAKAEQLARALADKDLLFQEIHHRIKNNLQMIGSMLTMQSLLVADDRARKALQEALTRIQTIGLVHQTLYQHNEAAQVEAAAYLRSVVAGLRRSYGTDGLGLTLEVDAESGMIDMDRAIPLALICSEALTNALKHAFPHGRQGTIRVTFGRDGDTYGLTVGDDGVGLPDGLADGSGPGLGVRLIRALARQLDGTVTFHADGGGTRVAVSFPA